MAERDKIVDFCNEHLKVEEIKDFSKNGMQVEGKEKVSKIALGVSSSLELFRKAAEWGADMIIVHHGLFWEKGTKDPKTDSYSFDITGVMKKRVKALIEKNISLLAYHHSLDIHSVIGNNAQFFLKSRIRPKGEFGYYKGKYFGSYADTKIARNELVKRINDIFDCDAKVYGKGPDMVKRVTFVSGHGVSVGLSEAIEKGIDTFITGSLEESDVFTARDGKINLISAGHYNSEKLGVQALGELIKKRFKVETKFIDTSCEV